MRMRVMLTTTLSLLLPLAAAGFWLQMEVADRIDRWGENRLLLLSEDAQDRLSGAAARLHEDLELFASEIQRDPILSDAFLDDRPDSRALRFAEVSRARRLHGLALLRIQDERGRDLSQGRAADPFLRVPPALADTLLRHRLATALGSLREPALQVLMAVDTVRVDGRLLRLLAAADLTTVVRERFRGEAGAGVSFLLPDPAVAGATKVLSSNLELADALADRIRFRSDESLVPLPAAGWLHHVTRLRHFSEGEGTAIREGWGWMIASLPQSELATLRRQARAGIVAVLGAILVVAVATTFFVARRVDRPIRGLTEAVAGVSLDRLHLGFATRRDDEVGQLARVLSDSADRLRRGARELQEAERRATQGEISRQVNHDIKNGLAPIRHALRHLAEVSETEPGRLVDVFRERKGTLEASAAYLETLAAHYARLSRPRRAAPCDLATIAREAAHTWGDAPGIRIEVQVDAGLPHVQADPTAVRRIIDNLLRNAWESLGGNEGTIILRLERSSPPQSRPQVWLVVEDDGPGIADDLRERIFEGFFSTRPEGAGLGLSIVRRLAGDFGGSVRAENRSEGGARFIVSFPSMES